MELIRPLSRKKKKKKLIFSKQETEWLKIPKRVSALEVLKKIRLPTRNNLLDRIDLTLTPYLKDPVSLIGNCKIQWIGIIGPTQSGKSIFLQTVIADMIDQDPGPAMYILPDENTGKKHLDEKIIQMINATPDFQKYKTDKKTDMSHKGVKLKHMTIHPAWAGSPVSMNSFPMKRVCLDEARLMPLSVKKETNAIKYAGDRLTTYFDFGIGQGYVVSSPSVEGDLLYKQIDKENTLYVSWQVPCPECREYQELDFFKNIKIKDDEAKCICVHCGAVFEDKDKKRSFNRHGKYVKLKKVGNKWEPTNDDNFDYGDYQRVFFNWSSLVSPFRSFKRIWNEFKQTKDSIHDYRNFWQCWLAKFWIDDKSRTSTVILKNHVMEGMFKGDVPSWCRVLTAGVDTQNPGFYVTVRAHGSERRTHLVDHFFIRCPMEIANYDEIAKHFKNSIFNRVFGLTTKWKIALCAIDSGGKRTKQVYEAARLLPRLILVKGAHESARTTITYNKDINLYHVRTSEYLEETDARSVDNIFTFPEDTSDEFFTQYCAVRKTQFTDKKTNREYSVWRKMGQNDYRMADVHSFICLDIPTDLGVFRHLVDVPDFKFNPYENERKVAESRIQRTVEEIPVVEDFEISNYNW